MHFARVMLSDCVCEVVVVGGGGGHRWMCVYVGMGGLWGFLSCTFACNCILCELYIPGT